MRRLIYGLLIITVLSQFPQVSESFKEEREGIGAACNKVETTYKTAADAYDKAQTDYEQVQESVTRLKADIDKGMAFAQEVKASASKSYGELKTQTGEVKLK